jgi:uncharacterized protein (TIGR02147 family)
MAVLVYEYTDYKQVIKDRLKDLKKDRPKFNLNYLSTVLDIQYTFLSKVMNSDSHHLSEDQVFTIGQTLELLDDDIEYLLLLRSYQASGNKVRKNYLFKKISAIQKSRNLSVNTEKPVAHDLGDEVRYLMDHQAMLVLTALSIKAVQKKPHMLDSLLGLEHARVKEILELLERMGRIEYDHKTREIKKLLTPRTHFGKDHPLIRTHQLVMKTALTQMSFAKNEEKKENLFATFTTDAAGFEKIKKQIKNFIAEIQKITREHTHTGVYQMNLDCIEIFQSS